MYIIAFMCFGRSDSVDLSKRELSAFIQRNMVVTHTLCCKFIFTCNSVASYLATGKDRGKRNVEQTKYDESDVFPGYEPRSQNAAHGYFRQHNRFAPYA